MPGNRTSINIDVDLWSKFLAALKLKKTNASAILRAYIVDYLAADEGGAPHPYPIPKHRDSTVSHKDQRYFDLLRIVLEHGRKDLYSRVVIDALEVFENTLSSDTLRTDRSGERSTEHEEKRGPGKTGHSAREHKRRD